MISDTFTRGNFSGSYNASFFFPVNQWQIGRQDYHRLLKEVRVEGMGDDGDEFQLYSEYVNFKPQNYTNNSAAFDVCALAPQVSITCQDHPKSCHILHLHECQCLCINRSLLPQVLIIRHV